MDGYVQYQTSFVIPQQNQNIQHGTHSVMLKKKLNYLKYSPAAQQRVVFFFYRYIREKLVESTLLIMKILAKIITCGQKNRLVLDLLSS